MSVNTIDIAVDKIANHIKDKLVEYDNDKDAIGEFLVEFINSERRTLRGIKYRGFNAPYFIHIDLDITRINLKLPERLVYYITPKLEAYFIAGKPKEEKL